VIALGFGLAVAGCSGVAPLGPAPSATPSARALGSPITVQAVLGRSRVSGGTCPAGYAALSGPEAAFAQARCYRKLGSPVTFTAASVGNVGQQNGPPTIAITLPAADRAALTAVSTQAYKAKGYVDIVVDGKSWAAPEALAPLTGGQFVIALPSSQVATQLQQLLVPSR